MKKQLSLVLIFVVLFMGLSGCIFKGNDNATPSSGQVAPEKSVSELVVLNNIPSDFEYLGNKSLNADYVSKNFVKAENVTEAAEGIYKNETLDYYITAIKFSDTASAESFLTDYKGTFKALKNNDTFQIVKFNGHEATRALSHSTVGGTEVSRYKYFWNNDNQVFIIAGNSNDSYVGLDFAMATGY
ncbi:hypothetical protein [uncultured Methanomethylovorans sp.]|uniref:hypothetical protein n=1 Tax=uncultured Methanomethylovorans sp. TaxID=183759 RepID=UPI002AA778E9|nr:hypothetical protein [uncultured Methanomethylovorans sp.]